MHLASDVEIVETPALVREFDATSSSCVMMLKQQIIRFHAPVFALPAPPFAACYNYSDVKDIPR
jgi:hypothetical protein